jgi:hypothetical protein
MSPRFSCKSGLYRFCQQIKPDRLNDAAPMEALIKQDAVTEGAETARRKPSIPRLLYST